MRGELLREGRLEKADGVQLGIEALKAVKAERTGKVVDYRHPLPGETEEIAGRDKFGEYTYEQKKKGGLK